MTRDKLIRQLVLLAKSADQGGQHPAADVLLVLCSALQSSTEHALAIVVLDFALDRLPLPPSTPTA